VIITNERIPLSALLLGLGGLIPFFACVIVIWTGISLPLIDDPARAMVAYGAVILSFLGGVRWGFALRMMDTGLQARTFCISVAPSVAAWFTLLGPTMMGLAMLPVMILLLGFADDQLPKIGVPVWYCKLRRVLTAAVVLACLAAVAGVVR
jgi:hypothetical protein